MKVTVAIILLSTIMLAGGCSNNSSSGNKEQPPIAANEQPDMEVTLLDNSSRNVRELTGTNVLIFFQPDCDHCQREAADIEKNLDAFGESRLYFITAAPLQEIVQFAKDYKLFERDKVYFGFTPAKNILDNYGAIAAPSVYIYSEKHKLIKSFNGEVSVEQILTYL